MENFKVLVLGVRGSGKTVFLSSMFHELSAPHEFGFYIEPKDSHKKRILNFTYSQLGDVSVNADTRWLEATAQDEIQDWTFDVMIHNGKGNFPAFTITYYDYAGGRLNDPSINDKGEFDNLVKEMDILIGMIDGYNLFKYIHNRIENQSFATSDLTTVINDLLKYHKEGKPIHLILTKWDIIKDKISFDDIIKELCLIPNFNRFLETTNSHKGVVRLIPVSSVGFDFAFLDNGIIRKKPNGQLIPFNVEYPLAMAILDNMRYVMFQKAELVNQKNNTKIKVEPKWTIWDYFLGTVGAVAEIISKELGGIKSTIFSKIAEYAKKNELEKIEAAKQRKIEIEAKIQQELNEVNDEISALNFVIENSFLAIESKFDIEFSKNNLKSHEKN